MKPHRDEYIRATAKLNNVLILLELQAGDFTNKHVKNAIEEVRYAIELFEDDIDVAVK